MIVIWSQVHTNAGKLGLWFLIIAGIGEAMASGFDVRHEIGHGIAGLLGVIGFPIAALLLSFALGRNETWRTARRALLRIANLSWIEIASARSACTGWVGEPPDGVVQLRLGTRCCVACDSGAP